MEADDPERAYPLCLLAMNRTGYHNLTLLISRAYMQGQHLGTPYVHKSWLGEAAEGVIALSGGAAGDVGQALRTTSKRLAILTDIVKTANSILEPRKVLDLIMGKIQQ